MTQHVALIAAWPLAGRVGNSALDVEIGDPASHTYCGAGEAARLWLHIYWIPLSTGGALLHAQTPLLMVGAHALLPAETLLSLDDALLHLDACSSYSQ